MKRYLLFILLFLVILNISLAVYYFYLERRKISFFCPVPKEHCHQGKVIEIDGKYFGVGYKVPPGTPILAALGGNTKGGGVLIKNGQRYPTVTIRNESGLAINYILTGEDYLKLARVVRTEEVTKAGEGVIGGWDVNFVVRVWQEKEGQYQDIEAKPGDFKNK